MNVLHFVRNYLVWDVLGKVRQSYRVNQQLLVIRYESSYPNDVSQLSELFGRMLQVAGLTDINV